MNAFYAKVDAAKNEEREYCRALLHHSQIMKQYDETDASKEMPCVSHTQLMEAYKAYQMKMGLSFGRHVYCVRKITCDFCMECDTCMFECKEAMRHYEWQSSRMAE
jgi:ferredoxin